MRIIRSLALRLSLALALPATLGAGVAAAHEPPAVRQDNREIRRDAYDVRADEIGLRRDLARRNAELRAGMVRAARIEQMRINHERRELRHDVREIRHDRVARRHDVRRSRGW